MEYVQVLVWFGMFSLLSILGVPIASALFAHLPGRGAGFALTLALGIVSLVVYWVGHLRFGLIALAAGLAVLGGCTYVAVARGAEVDWGAFGESMTVFTVAFLFQVAIRAVDPGILFFMEDFLDYGMMRAILRSSTLPPEDFWFAGTPVRYHYGGHLVAAVETLLTGTRPSVAYNLARAGFYAMLLTCTYELTAAIAAARGRSRRLAGAVGVYFVGFAGNLLVPTIVAVHALPDSVRPAVAETIASQLHENPAGPVLDGFAEFEYWFVLQMMPNALTSHPFVAWFHGELHAHMTSTPYLLLVAGICYNYFRTPATNELERRILVFVVVPVAVGFTVLTDILSLPTSLGIAWLTLHFAPASPTTLVPDRVRKRFEDRFGSAWNGSDGSARVELRRAVVSTVFTGIVAFLAVVVSAPFVTTLSGGGESVAVVSNAERSGGIALLIIHGAFLALFCAHLAGLVRPSRGDLSSAFLTSAVVGIALVVLVALLDAPVLLLVVPVLAVGWYLLRVDGRADFETLLVLAGGGLVLLADFVYFTNQDYVIDGRGNTVFRAYMHTWVFWGVAAGAILPQLLRPPDVAWRRLPGRRTVTTGFVAAIVVLTALYGGITTFDHFDRAFEEPPESGGQAEYVYYASETQNKTVPPTDPPTIEGLLYAEVNHPNETLAIEWLDRNVDGTPTIVTGPGGRWEWRSAPASLTGIPTVAGWGHELVYRDWDGYYDRVDDVRAIYSGSPERRIELLEKYDVRYVWVGPDERARYDVWEFDILDGVEAVYRNSEVTIYAVHQRTLDYSPEPIGTVTYDVPTIWTNSSAVRNVGSRNDTAVSNDTLAWWGPYLTLPPGNYAATFRVAVNESGRTSPREPVVVLDVARGAEANGTADFHVLANASVNGTDGVRTVTVPFTLDQPAGDVEFRGTLVDGNGTVSFHGVTLQRRTDSQERVPRPSVQDPPFP